MKTKYSRKIDYTLFHTDFFGDISVERVKIMLQKNSLNELMLFYNLMLSRDPHIYSQISKRTIQLVSSPYKIEGGTQQMQSFIKDYFKNVNLRNLLTDMLSGLAYGFSIFDMVWEQKGAYFLPKLYFLPQKFFDNDHNGLFIMLKNFKKLYIEDEKKFLLHLHKAESGNIVNYGILRKLAWLFTLKAFITAQYANHAELLGVPPIIFQGDTEDPDKIVDQVLELRSNSAGYFPKDATVQLMEGKADRNTFIEFIKYADKEISQVILGQTLTSDIGDSGSRAAAEVHNDVRKDYQKSDAVIIEESMNKLIKTVIDMNFSGVKKYPEYRFDIEDYLDENRKAETIKKLIDAGYEIPEEYISETFNIPGIKKKQEKQNNSHNSVIASEAKQSQTSSNAANFADKIDREAANVDTKSFEDHILELFEDIVVNTTSYNDAFNKMIEKYPDINFDLLEKTLEKHIANSKLLGAAETYKDE